MSSFEWMELQTLTADIATARSRLTTARSKKDSRLVRLLESEIAAAEDRRARLLSHITSDLADQPGQAPEPVPPAGDTAAEPVSPPVPADEFPATTATEAEAAAAAAELPPAPAEPQPEPAIAAAAAVGAMSPGAAGWARLTPADLAVVAERLRGRRAETLTRHAAELKQLAVERIQVEALEQAIDAFTRKFATAAPPSRGAAVVQLEEAREIRAQGRA